MSKNKEIQVPDTREILINKRRGKWVSKAVTIFTSIIITLPIFAILYKYVPEIKLVIANTYNLRLDYLLAFLIIFSIVNLLVSLIQKILLGLFIMLLIVFSFNFFFNKYSFFDVFNDYKTLVYYLIEEPIKVPFLPESANFRNADRIMKAIQFDDPNVRNTAIVLSLKNFSDDYYYRKYGNVVRFFSIFKEMKSNWHYVPDPVQEDYYASANESLIHYSGDCDDYSILTVSLIKSIGGEVRLVRTIGHIYPEVKVCHQSDLQEINLLIRELFEDETKGKSIYFHADAEGYIWLNFDYTDTYPGGKFMNIKVVDILNV